MPTRCGLARQLGFVQPGLPFSNCTLMRASGVSDHLLVFLVAKQPPKSLGRERWSEHRLWWIDDGSGLWAWYLKVASAERRVHGDGSQSGQIHIVIGSSPCGRELDPTDSGRSRVPPGLPNDYTDSPRAKRVGLIRGPDGSTPLGRDSSSTGVVQPDCNLPNELLCAVVPPDLPFPAKRAVMDLPSVGRERVSEQRRRQRQACRVT